MKDNEDVLWDRASKYLNWLDECEAGGDRGLLMVRFINDENRSKDKEIKALKLDIVNKGSDLLVMQKAAREIERELAKSRSAHEKQVHHMDGEINRQINKVASAEKKRDALEKQLDKTKSNYLFQISEQDAEIEKLNERLARMGEYVGSVQQELIAVDNPVCDQQPLIDDLENALSSYDPKWIESVRAEAKKKAMVTAYDKFLSSREEQFVNWISREANQPNQSREERG